MRCRKLLQSLAFLAIRILNLRNRKFLGHSGKAKPCFMNVRGGLSDRQLLATLRPLLFYYPVLRDQTQSLRNGFWAGQRSGQGNK